MIPRIVVFVVRRLLTSIPVLIGVTFITFFVSHVIVGDPVRAWIGFYTNQEIINAYTVRYHLNDPLWQQYLFYMRDLVTGNWGISPITGREVLAEIETYFPATVELVIAAVLLSFLVGVSLGTIAALRNNTKTDFAITTLYLGALNSPSFVSGLLLQFVFAYYFALLPSVGIISATITIPRTITGFIVMDSLLTANWPAFWSSLDHLVLPTIALATIVFGSFTRLTRSAMLEVQNKDYMRAARAKGLNRYYVNVRHGLRTALIPPVTSLAIVTARLLGGAVVIEYIFGWPGIGTYLVTAILNSNFPDIIGVTTIFALGVILSNLVADILYAVLDPRVRI